MEYYEKERVQSSSTGLQTQVQKLSRDNEVLRTLLDPSSVSEDHRHQSLTNRFKSPPADWEDTSTWTQTPCLINFEYGELQGQVNGYFQALDSYLCLGAPLQDNTELADCNYSFLIEKHHIRSPILPMNLCRLPSQMVLSLIKTSHLVKPFLALLHVYPMRETMHQRIRLCSRFTLLQILQELRH